jgi:hypothetical protein
VSQHAARFHRELEFFRGKGARVEQKRRRGQGEQRDEQEEAHGCGMA